MIGNKKRDRKANFSDVKWVSSFLTALQHNIGYIVPYRRQNPRTAGNCFGRASRYSVQVAVWADIAKVQRVSEWAVS